jgi:ATP-dependent Clp protease ATP-binding subunit ClpB
MFEPLTQTEIREVVKLQIASVQKMLEGNGITLSLTDAAIDLLTREGYDPEFGARPVKRAIQRLLLNDLSKAILAGQVSRDHAISVDAAPDGQHLAFA